MRRSGGCLSSSQFAAPRPGQLAVERVDQLTAAPVRHSHAQLLPIDGEEVQRHLRHHRWIRRHRRSRRAWQLERRPAAPFFSFVCLFRRSVSQRSQKVNRPKRGATNQSRQNLSTCSKLSCSFRASLPCLSQGVDRSPCVPPPPPMLPGATWLWVKTQETPGEPQNRWHGVHPPHGVGSGLATSHPLSVPAHEDPPPAPGPVWPAAARRAPASRSFSGHWPSKKSERQPRGRADPTGRSCQTL